MKITLYTADTVGDAVNTRYPNQKTITNEQEMKEAAMYDHVCAEYDGARRGIDYFLKSDVVVMDCDNDHSDSPEDWITPEKLEEMLVDVAYVMVPSRNHMKDKGAKAARPRFHVYFPVSDIADAKQYADLKRGIREQFPFFDANALDAARFIFGSDTGIPVWHEGWVQIDDEIKPVPAPDITDAVPAAAPEREEAEKPVPPSGKTIPEGMRNNTMSRFALRVLVRFGNCPKAYEAFLEQADKCIPPLPDRELDTIWKSAEKYYESKIAGAEGYIAPEEYGALFALESLKPDDYSDLGEAKVMARELPDELLFTNGTGWMRYNGKVWVENRQYAIGAMENFLDMQLADAKQSLEVLKKKMIEAGVPEETVRDDSADFRKCLPKEKMHLADAYDNVCAYIKFVSKRRDYRNITAMCNAAAPMMQHEIGELDKEWYLINTPDATYDIREGLEGGREHSPDDYLTKITSCSPGDKGKQMWLDAVEMFFSGDRELIEYVQMAVGMAAIGKVFLEQLIIAYGDGGNGKSTFFNAIYRVMGSYAGKLASDVLTTSARRNTMPAKAELKGKRLVISSETEEGMRLNMEIIKQLCSTDEISAEKKYKDPFEFVPSHTLVLYTNHLPKVGTHDDGTWRRLVVIPFNAKLTGKGDIKNYADYLVENAGPYILAWVLEGAKKAIERKFNFDFPEVVQKAIAEYMEENDWFGHYLEDNCEVAPDYSEKSGALYQNYRAYCFSNGEYARSTTDFYKTLEHAGFKRKKTSAGMIVSGLKLRAQDTDDDFLR